MEDVEVKQEITLDDLAARMDMFGEQMNWLCENLQSLFAFVNQVGQSGGGIRGLLQAAKAAPQLKENGSE
jgi:hypothetical protein